MKNICRAPLSQPIHSVLYYAGFANSDEIHRRAQFDLTTSSQTPHSRFSLPIENHAEGLKQLLLPFASRRYRPPCRPGDEASYAGVDPGYARKMLKMVLRSARPTNR
jgi:hypothetical protein